MRERSKSEALYDRCSISEIPNYIARDIYRIGFEDGRAQGFICGALLMIVVWLLV
jgi:hypothetical protein